MNHLLRFYYIYQYKHNKGVSTDHADMRWKISQTTAARRRDFTLDTTGVVWLQDRCVFNPLSHIKE